MFKGKNDNDKRKAEANAEENGTDGENLVMPTPGGEDTGVPEGLEGLEGFDEDMLRQAGEMMERLQRVDDLERENAELKGRLARLASDFEGYRTRTGKDIEGAEGQGVSRAAQALMPVYDDIDRALKMGSEDPAKLIPGMQAVQQKVLSVFAGLGLEATGQEGEPFDPELHEALQVIPGDGDTDTVAEVYQLGFSMAGRCVRPARVVVRQRQE